MQLDTNETRQVAAANVHLAPARCMAILLSLVKAHNVNRAVHLSLNLIPVHRSEYDASRPETVTPREKCPPRVLFIKSH